MHLKLVAERLKVFREPSADSVVSELVRGDNVEQISYYRSDPSWVEVNLPDDTRGWAKRIAFRQTETGGVAPIPDTLLQVFNETLWEITSEYQNVRYKLGAKRPQDGEVDCSGWIFFLCKQAFQSVNNRARRPVFATGNLKILNTHSDHQVSLTGYRVGQIFSERGMSELLWRPGLLVGLNFGDYAWEMGQGRVFEIDHIVQIMEDPADGTLYITQSSSSGGGVNRVELGVWIDRCRDLIDQNRVHVVDALKLGEWQAIESDAPLELPELDVTTAPPG